MSNIDTYRQCQTQLIYLNVAAIHPPSVTTSYGYMSKLYSPSQIFLTQHPLYSSLLKKVLQKSPHSERGQKGWWTKQFSSHKQKKLAFNGQVWMFAFSIDASSLLWSLTACLCPLLSFSVQNTQSQISNWAHHSYWSACCQNKVATLCPAKWVRNSHVTSQSETASSADLQLSLFHDGEGMIRCRERPKYVDLPERRTHPILVPASSVLATLIINDSHRQVPHVGTRHNLAWTRLQYWIPNRKASVKRVINDC